MPLTNPQSADHLAAAAGSFEPQRQNNFSVEIPLDGSDKGVIMMSLMSSALPTESNDEVEIQHQNEKRYVAGQANFDTVPLVVRDFVDQDARGAIMRWRQLVYNKNTGAVGLASDYKKEVFIVMSGPDGSSERVCKLIGCWPQSVTGGTLDYAGSDPVSIEVTLRFDKAIYETGSL